jgi:hypothetical protein
MNSSVFWEPGGGLVASLHAHFLFSSLFDPEEGRMGSSGTSYDFQPTTRLCILERSILHNHRCQNHKPYIANINC